MYIESLYGKHLINLNAAEEIYVKKGTIYVRLKSGKEHIIFSGKNREEAYAYCNRLWVRLNAESRERLDKTLR